MTLRCNSLGVAALLIAWCTLPASADTTTWGWAAAPDLQVDSPILSRVWQNADGSTGSHLIMPPASSFLFETEGQTTKAVVVVGDVSVANATLREGAFAVLPTLPSHDFVCAAASGCLLYLEQETEGPVDDLIVIAADDIPWFDVPNTGGSVSLAWVWGEAETPAPSSFFLRFQPGFPGFQHAHSHSYRGLALQGGYTHWEPGDGARTALEPGATFWQSGIAAHDDACDGQTECIAYFRIESTFDIFPAD